MVKLYVCGITPYDATHLGHAFTFAAFDVLIRYLHHLGHHVRYVQNVTDVDDPLFEKARQLGIPYQQLAQEEVDGYLADMRDLNLVPPDVFPHASEEIAGMIEMVQRLVERGYAYQVDGHVYFSIASDRDYGEVSGYSRDTMIELARLRGGNPDDPRRRDPLDFVLWRPSGSDEPHMSSPWGEGLPGWHLECSTMSLKYLGAPIDIHGGGSDLIFPHHENETAQSEGATDIHPFVRYWLHTGMVYLGGEKMSKSLGNMVFVRDLLPQFGPDALRLYLSGCHYRGELHYEEEEVRRAADLAAYLARLVTEDSADAAPETDFSSYKVTFEERMNDDLDTPGAIVVLRDLAAAIEAARTSGAGVRAGQKSLRTLSNVLGLRLDGAGPRPSSRRQMLGM